MNAPTHAPTLSRWLVVTVAAIATLLAGGLGLRLGSAQTPPGDSKLAVAGPTDVSIGPHGVMAVLSQAEHRVHLFRLDGSPMRTLGREGTGGGTEFQNPSALAWTPDGRLYVADTGNHRIQLFDRQGFFRRMWGQPGKAPGRFDSPRGIAADHYRAYVADSGNGRIQVFDRIGVFQFEIGKHGTGEGEFRNPQSVAVDEGGFIYVADTDNDRIQKFSPAGKFVAAWGESGSGPGQFDEPSGIAYYQRSLIVVDRGNHRFQVFDESGQPRPDEFIALPGALRFPRRLSVARDGSLVATCDGRECRLFSSSRAEASEPPTRWSVPPRVRGAGSRFLLGSDSTARVFEARGNSLEAATVFGGPGPDLDRFGRVTGVAIDSARGRVYLSDGARRRLVAWDTAADGGPRLLLSLDLDALAASDPRLKDRGAFVPGPLAVDGDGNLALLAPTRSRVLLFGPDLQLAHLWGTYGAEDGQLRRAVDIAVDPSGSPVFVLDGRADRVQAFDRDGTFRFGFGGTGSGEGQLNEPRGIARAPDGHIYVADTGNGRIQKYDAKGQFVASWRGATDGQKALDLPTGVAVGAQGEVLVIDPVSGRGRLFSPDGEALGWIGLP